MSSGFIQRAKRRRKVDVTDDVTGVVRQFIVEHETSRICEI